MLETSNETKICVSTDLTRHHAGGICLLRLHLHQARKLHFTRLLGMFSVKRADTRQSSTGKISTVISE